MAYGFVQAAASTGFSVSGNHATFGATTGAGNFLALSVFYVTGTSISPSSNITDNSGSNVWHFAVGIKAGGGSGVQQEIWYCENCAATGALQVVAAGASGQTGGCGMAMAEYSGVTTTNSLDTTGRTTTVFVTAVTATGGTVSASGELIVGGYTDSFNSSGNPVVAGAGFTRRAFGAFDGQPLIEDAPGPSAGITASAGGSGADGFVTALMAAFKLGGSAGPAPLKPGDAIFFGMT